MRYNTTLAAIGLLGLAAISAVAQAPPLDNTTDIQTGSGTIRHDGVPRSKHDSNISARDTRSNIAPELPMPAIGINASPLDYLRSARCALTAGRTGLAQQALEMAETRALDRSVPQEWTYQPSDDQIVVQIAGALQALEAGDRLRAIQIIDTVLTQ